jgi:hypothetical protein
MARIEEHGLAAVLNHASSAGAADYLEPTVGKEGNPYAQVAVNSDGSA